MGSAFARGMSNAIKEYVDAENKKIDAYNANLEKCEDGSYKDPSLVKQRLSVNIEFVVDLDAFQAAEVGVDKNAQDNYFMKTKNSWAGGAIPGSNEIGNDNMKGHHPSHAPTKDLPKGKMNPKSSGNNENPTQ